jgi:hypothetical protein
MPGDKERIPLRPSRKVDSAVNAVIETCFSRARLYSTLRGGVTRAAGPNLVPQEIFVLKLVDPTFREGIDRVKPFRDHATSPRKCSHHDYKTFYGFLTDARLSK